MTAVAAGLSNTKSVVGQEQLLENNPGPRIQRRDPGRLALDELCGSNLAR